MINVFLLLGTNLGNRQMFLQQALTNIEYGVGHIVKTSSVYETQSWGKTDEPDYLNQVVLVQTDMAAAVLLHAILEIEAEMGRERKEKWGARTIDIDILFYGDAIIDVPGLTVPHPQLQHRRFTLEPLAEIAPELVHPVLKKDILLLKKELTDSLIVKKL